MPSITRTIVHIRTIFGAIFSVHENDEDMRQSLIDYFNQILADEDGLDEFATLTAVIGSIQEFQEVSIEEVSIHIEAGDEGRGLYLLDNREHATALAALRLWQRSALETGDAPMISEWDVATSGGEITPLDADEVDALCEGFNT
jgi:hypothetical protein